MSSIGDFASRTLRIVIFGIAVATGLAAFATGAQASLVISTAPTSNVYCTSNSCTQVGKGAAVLNVTQLQTMLASSSVSITAKENIGVNAEITWASANTLTLHAQYGTLSIDQPIVVTGGGGLALVYLISYQQLFGPKGNVTFWSTSSNLTVNANSYVLVNSIAMLASDIAANKSVNYALANSYNASADGTYASSPIASFGGNFLGLNNTISNLSIADSVAGDKVGLFAEYTLGEIQNNASSLSWLNLKGARIKGKNDSQVGGIVGVNKGDLVFDSVRATISTGKTTYGVSLGAIAGGLVGLNYGDVEDSYAEGTVIGSKNAIIGGVVGENGVNDNIPGDVGAVYSTAAVSLDSGVCTGCSVGGPENSAGGIVGVNYGSVISAYATGAVTGGSFANVGGLIGLDDSTASSGNSAVNVTYSTSTITGGSGSSVGGSIGFDADPGYAEDVYWDTTTSGVTNASQGSGNIANNSGITGLTTTQLQSGLPDGFNSGIWGEKPSINGGLPYLLAIPPK